MSDCNHDGELPDDWTEEQAAMFNRVYRHMLANQRAFVHPQAAPVSDEHWSTTAWNSAWLAAHCAGDKAPLIIRADDTGEVFSAEIAAEGLQ